jgi:Flp pilus assembly protein TadG
MILMVAAVADLGRVYTSAVAIEAAAREAADFGSFQASNWSTTPTDNRSTTVALMEKRACTAAWGSHLDGYEEPSGTVAHATCTNPSFSYTMEPDDPSCSNVLTEPPCVVHVRMTYEFRLFIGMPPMPGSITLVRDSRFQMQDLQAPT